MSKEHAQTNELRDFLLGLVVQAIDRLLFELRRDGLTFEKYADLINALNIYVDRVWRELR